MAGKITPSIRRAPADLSLDQDDIGARFMMLVVIMTTALATISTGGALAVHAMRAGWVSSVSGHMTIEIPASDSQNIIRGADMLEGIAQRLRNALAKSPDVRQARVMPRAEVEKLVEPWLGDTAAQGDMPLPALVALTLKNPGDQEAIARVQGIVRDIDASAISETHESWLLDLKRFSLMLMLAAGAMAAATIACAILTVAGAVKARLSAHHEDIALLHVMGATDSYIGSQFVRIVVRDVGRAALLGTAAGLVLLKAGGFAAGGLESASFPAFSWNFTAFAAFAAIPALITALCWGAARVTVLRTLRVMP